MTKEKMFEDESFAQRFGKELYLEEIFLKYDGIPILSVCIDENGNRYFCHCAEMRDFETWAIYPVTIGQLLQIINNGKSPQEVLGVQGQKVWIYRIYWDGRESSMEATLAELLLECDALPKGVPLCLHPEQVAVYAKELQDFDEKSPFEKSVASFRKAYHIDIAGYVASQVEYPRKSICEIIFDKEITKGKDWDCRNEYDWENGQFQLSYEGICV